MTDAGPALRRRGFGFAAALLGAFAFAAIPVAQAAQVTVDVSNVRSTKGHIRVSICPKATFLQLSCPYETKAAASVGVTRVAFGDIPPGTYAAQVFQDEHDDGIVHRDLLGFPTEGIGFSNDAPLYLKGPKFNDAAFQVRDQPVEIRLRLRRLRP